MSEKMLKSFADLKVIQKIQDKISDATGLCLYITDGETMLTEISGPTILSNDIIMKSDKASKMVNDFVSGIKINAERFKKISTAVCSNGIVKIAVPIVVDDELFGIVEGGDVFVSKQTIPELKKTAKEYDIDAEAYKEAALQVSVIDIHTVEKICSMISDVFCEYVSECKKKAFDSNVNYDGANNSQIVSNINRINEMYNTSSKETQSVKEVIDQLTVLTKDAADNIEKTKDIVKAIQNIALNTRILGFNASIEAARAKESGKGFGVIAQEVRSLADVSKSSAEEIEDRINKLVNSTNQIFEAIDSAAKHFAVSAGVTEEINQLFADIVSLTENK